MSESLFARKLGQGYFSILKKIASLHFMFLHPSKLLTKVLLVVIFCEFIAPALVPVAAYPRSSQVVLQRSKLTFAFTLLFQNFKSEEKEEKDGEKEHDRCLASELPNVSFTISTCISDFTSQHCGVTPVISKVALYQRHCIYII
jgi:hypothetical protein